MEFRWNDWNVEHVERHSVAPEEAEQVVRTASRPWPTYGGDGRWLVWGRGQGGRFLQVVFIIDEDDVVFVIHARPLTDTEKKRIRRRESR